MNYYIHDNNWTVILDDFDIAKASQDDINQIGCLLATNTLVVIKNQSHLTVKDQVRIAQMFGNVEDLKHHGDIPPFKNFILPESDGKIARVTGELDEHGEPGLFGHVSDLDWHCNQPGMPTRMPLVWLFGVKGTAGSRTSWTNNILAYQDLDQAWKEKINDLKMICGWKKDTYSEYDFGKAKNDITEDFNFHYNPSLVHTNVGGQTGLFFPFLQFRNFVGLSEEESLEIVKPLSNHVLQEKYIYHHDWQDGDIVISEQWLGIHKRWKFDGMPNRLLHRICFDFANIDLSTIRS
jgi:alpha-ketoglutarate-dependent taurine dioxygenase